jgi:hypothetical protein
MEHTEEEKNKFFQGIIEIRNKLLMVCKALQTEQNIPPIVMASILIQTGTSLAHFLVEDEKEAYEMVERCMKTGCDVAKIMQQEFEKGYHD